MDLKQQSNAVEQIETRYPEQEANRSIQNNARVSPCTFFSFVLVLCLFELFSLFSLFTALASAQYFLFQDKLTSLYAIILEYILSFILPILFS